MGKSIPLDKITDLRLEQGCIQKCFNVEAIVVETASASQAAPEMSLVGLYKPKEVRRMVLNVRDRVNGNAGMSINVAGSSLSFNPLLPSPDTKELQTLMSKQNDTMLEIKDVLKDMRSALVSMDKKMEQGQLTNQ